MVKAVNVRTQATDIYTFPIERKIFQVEATKETNTIHDNGERPIMLQAHWIGEIKFNFNDGKHYFRFFGESTGGLTLFCVDQ